ncbi:adenylate kinase [Herbinix luporum]|uniref:Adenylate kinase n=1 Tax=Herbinix luporum TaxID=1679721 RepID=A0A0K8J2M8_9FIRM|nr:adenylate kinase [Herbinix luporum]CUH91891.1 Adenylate kinase [Herbinix luporum]
MKIIMLGAPGAGKGTQAKKIAQEFGIPHISTGDIFRENIKNNTQLGIKAKEYIDQGLLVPDELVMDLIIDRFKANDCKDGYVLDGFPRTIYQAEALDKKLKNKNESIDHVINIEVSDELIVRRMSGRRACLNCGRTYHIKTLKPKVEDICDYCNTKLVLRDDDKPETVKKRLQVYHEQTQPLIDYYNQKGLLRSMDGTKDIEVLYKEIMDFLKD